MAKYLKKTKTKKVIRPWHVVLLVLLLVLGGAGIWLAQLHGENTPPATDPDPNAEVPSTQTSEEITVPSTEETLPEFQTITLEGGLQINRIGSYAGLYMEDGSDEIVSDIMMILLENTSEQDLQLARLELVYDGFTAEFEVTNLPAGCTAVVLEKNRGSVPQGRPLSAAVKNVAFFPEEMTLLEDKLSITGGNGYLEVSNISGQDITADIYIYYKNYTDDLYYGGITYRARLEGGIPADGVMRVVAGHYSPEGSILQLVTCSE